MSRNELTLWSGGGGAFTSDHFNPQNQLMWRHSVMSQDRVISHSVFVAFNTVHFRHDKVM